MAASSSLDIHFPKETLAQLSELSRIVEIPNSKNKQNIVEVLGKAVRLLKIATEADEVSIKKNGKEYIVNISNL